jgi:UV excision repair protein RAD23
MGENYNKAVDDICNMGFPREDVVKAMQAAFNNPDRAIEYLINVYLFLHLNILKFLYRVFL